MTNIDKNMSDLLGITPMSELKEEIKQEVVPVPTDQLPIIEQSSQQEDFEYARDTLKAMIEKAKDAVEEMSELAPQAENPRTFEVMSDTIRTVGETVDRLVDLHKKQKDLNSPSKKSGIEIDKAVVFSGGASELLKHIKENK